jgi:RimJ/RimL family protein N-acetyltransferase
MYQAHDIVFCTERLIIRVATQDDIALYYALWTNPEVMKHVGFPDGIPLDFDEMKSRPFERGETEFDQLLVVTIKETGQPIGECKLPRPDDDGMAEPDIKLLPAFWGKGYGREGWLGIVSYLFEYTDCDVIKTTPNVDNIAAIKIYESAGAVREGQDVYHFPDSMQDYTTPVHCFIYRLYRSDWRKK